MATRLNPYLTFSGNARKAMEFYKRRARRRTAGEHLWRVWRRGIGGGRRDAREPPDVCGLHAHGVGHAARFRRDAQQRNGQPQR